MIDTKRTQSNAMAEQTPLDSLVTTLASATLPAAMATALPAPASAHLTALPPLSPDTLATMDALLPMRTIATRAFAATLAATVTALTLRAADAKRSLFTNVCCSMVN